MYPHHHTYTHTGCCKVRLCSECFLSVQVSRRAPRHPRAVGPPGQLCHPPAQDPAYSAACPFCQRASFGVAYTCTDPLSVLPASPLLACSGRVARARGSTTSTSASPALGAGQGGGSSSVVTVSVRDREQLQLEITRDSAVAALPPPAFATPQAVLGRSLRSGASAARQGVPGASAATATAAALMEGASSSASSAPRSGATYAPRSGGGAAPPPGGREFAEGSSYGSAASTSGSGAQSRSQWRRDARAQLEEDDDALDEQLLQHALRESARENALLRHEPRGAHPALEAAATAAAAPLAESPSLAAPLSLSTTAPVVAVAAYVPADAPDDDDADALAAAIELSMLLLQEEPAGLGDPSSVLLLAPVEQLAEPGGAQPVLPLPPEDSDPVISTAPGLPEPVSPAGGVPVASGTAEAADRADLLRGAA